MNEGQKRVLIVDDEEDLTWTLSKKLSKDRDKFEVTCVNSGREAIDILNQVPFDLVITDVRMPEVSGLDLLVKVKELYPTTKVVIMTAYGTSDVQKAANERGCFNYIEKPFEINELRQLIIDALKRKKGFKGSVSDFQLGDIIQLNCLGRLTSALRIKTEEEQGTIYFQEGNIVHAETERFEGENAFYHIMSWQGESSRHCETIPPSGKPSPKAGKVCCWKACAGWMKIPTWQRKRPSRKNAGVRSRLCRCSAGSIKLKGWSTSSCIRKSVFRCFTKGGFPIARK